MTAAGTRGSTRDEGAKRLALFDSIHTVLAAERACRDAGLWHDLVPVPRDLSSDCGMAVLFRSADLPAVRSLLNDLSLRPRSVHEPRDGAHRDVSDEFTGRSGEDG